MDAYCAMSTFHVEILGEYLAPHLCPKQENRQKKAEHVLLCLSFFKKICPRMRQTEGDTFGASHSYFCPRPKNLSCSPSSSSSSCNKPLKCIRGFQRAPPPSLPWEGGRDGGLTGRLEKKRRRRRTQGKGERKEGRRK